MGKRVCPWWLGYVLACRFLRWGQDPAKILAPHVHEGMTVLEPGPGMGFFTLELASRVGPSGRVIAVDVQAKMLEGLRRRASQAGLLAQIDVRLCSADSLPLSDLAGRVDFTLAFAVVHELPAASAFFAAVAEASKPGARLLFAEPAGHVKGEEFEAELQTALQAGFELIDRPAIQRTRAVLLERKGRTEGANLR